MDEQLQDEDLVDVLEFLIPELYNAKEAEETKAKIENKVQVHKNIFSLEASKAVDPMCEAACQRLWDRNIFTKGIVKSADSISIILDKLSYKNQLEFELKAEENPNKYVCENGNYRITIYKVNKNENEIKDEFYNSVQMFKMQDVESGFISKDKFLMEICDCEKVEGVREYASNDGITIDFDSNKMEKSFEDYLKEKNYENLYVPSENRIYLNKFYLDGHKKFLLDF